MGGGASKSKKTTAAAPAAPAEPVAPAEPAEPAAPAELVTPAEPETLEQKLDEHDALVDGDQQDVKAAFASVKKDAEPETVEPETVEPETVEPETAEPETVEPETAEPETAEPETVEPETVEPETAEPETKKPETVEPETVEPETVEPETAEPVTAEDEAAKPDTKKPETVEPEAAEPEAKKPETAEPVTAEPEAPADNDKELTWEEKHAADEEPTSLDKMHRDIDESLAAARTAQLEKEERMTAAAKLAPPTEFKRKDKEAAPEDCAHPEDLKPVCELKKGQAIFVDGVLLKITDLSNSKPRKGGEVKFLLYTRGYFDSLVKVELTFEGTQQVEVPTLSSSEALVLELGEDGTCELLNEEDGEPFTVDLAQHEEICRDVREASADMAAEVLLQLCSMRGEVTPTGHRVRK